MRWLRLLRLLHQLRWLRLLRHLRSIYCSFGFRIGALAALPEIGPAARSCVDGTDARSCVFKTVTFTRMGRLKGTFFDAPRVRPIGSTLRGYLLRSFRGYQRFDQWLQLSYLPSKSRLHAIVELRRSSISWLSGGNNARQTQRTVGIYGPVFCNYWFDYHQTWQKWSRRINFVV